MTAASEPQTKYLKDYSPPTHQIESTGLRFELGEDETLVTSKLQIRRNPASTAEGRTLTLDGSSHLTLLEVKINGRALKADEFTLTEKSLTLKDLPEAFTLEVSTSIQPQNNTELSGLYKSGGKFCTQCEAEGFRNITYYLDRPDTLSVFTTEVIADGATYPQLLSNGNLVEQKPLPDGRRYAKWIDPFPKPSYLFALVAGDMDLLEDKFVTMSGRAVTLRLFVDKGDLGKAQHAMDSIKRSMSWDEVAFGREYDLDLFQVVAVQDFNFGAMENKGLNIFNASVALANPQTATDADHFNIESVIGHEYFHNWSGDRVTCRDWHQLSLKEGFTVFRDQCFSADMHSPTAQRIQDVGDLRARQFPEDAGPMAHPIRPDSYMSIDNFYTATVYDKGAEVIRMMQTLLGKEGFRLGTDLYFSRHDGQAVTTGDFVKAMEDANGVDLSQFERTWYNQAGTPVLTITDAYDPKSKTYSLRVRQQTPATPGQPTKEPFHIPLRIGLIGPNGSDMKLQLASHPEVLTAADVLNVTQREQEFVFKEVAHRPTPSLLRNFSAPVKVQYDYSRNQLAFLMQHDSDGFNRWEASQKLAVEVLLEMVNQNLAGRPMEVDPLLTESLRKALSDTGLDKMMVASMLTLPSESYLAELTQGPVHPESIHAAREAVYASLGQSLSDLLEKTYAANRSDEPYRFATQDMSRRQLKNVAMAYLSAAGRTEFAQAQFAAHQNMTDVSAALRDIVDSDNKAARETALAEFYAKWKDDPQVVNKWFGIQAISEKHCSLERVMELMRHAAFDKKNPNKVRALIGTYASGNINFHAKDGSGYAFLADQVIELDQSNKQLAARLMTPLTKWHMYDESRQQQMRAELERIVAQPGISENVYEIASKSLAFKK